MELKVTHFGHHILLFPVSLVIIIIIIIVIIIIAELRRPEGPQAAYHGKEKETHKLIFSWLSWQAEPHAYHGKEKETRELIFSWLSWLTVLLVGAWTRTHDDDDDDDGGVAQHGGHTPKKRHSLGLPCTSLILDIHTIIN